MRRCGNRCRRSVPTISTGQARTSAGQQEAIRSAIASDRADHHVEQPCAAEPECLQWEACAKEDGVAARTMPITSILPDAGWAPLLEIIVREASTASVIEVNTAGMQVL